MVTTDCPTCQESQAPKSTALPKSSNELTKSTPVDLYAIPLDELCPIKDQMDPKPTFPRLKSVDASVDDMCADLDKYDRFRKMNLNQIYAVDKNIGEGNLGSLFDFNDISGSANDAGDMTPEDMQDMTEEHPSMEKTSMNNFNNMVENTPDKGGSGFNLGDFLFKYPLLGLMGIGAFALNFIMAGFGLLSLASILDLLGKIPGLFSFGFSFLSDLFSLIPPLGSNTLSLTSNAAAAGSGPPAPAAAALSLPAPAPAIPPIPGSPPIAIPPLFPAIPAIPELPDLSVLAGILNFLNPFAIIGGLGLFSSLSRTLNKNNPDLGGKGNEGGSARTPAAMQKTRGNMFDIKAETENRKGPVTVKESAYESGQEVETEETTDAEKKQELSDSAKKQNEVGGSLPGTGEDVQATDTPNVFEAQPSTITAIPEAITANDVSTAVSKSGLKNDASYTAIAVALANNGVIPNTSGCISLAAKILKQKNLDLNSPSADIAGALNAEGFRMASPECAGPVSGLVSEKELVEPAPNTSLVPKSESPIQGKAVEDNYFIQICGVDGGVDQSSLNITSTETVVDQSTGKVIVEEVILVKNGELIQEGSTMTLRNNANGCTDIVITTPPKERGEKSASEVRTVDDIQGDGKDKQGNDLSLEKSCPTI